MNILNILREFPAIWATLGLLTGGATMFWVTKKFGPMRSEALKEVVDAYKEQVSAQINLAKLQADANTAALQMQKDHWSEELAKLEHSRDEYKETLHAVRNDLGSENTGLKLKIQELEMRPSVEGIATEQQTFYREMLVTMKGISDAIRLHDEGIDSRIAPLQEACHETASSMKALVKLINRKSKTPRVRMPK